MCAPIPPSSSFDHVQCAYNCSLMTGMGKSTPISSQNLYPQYPQMCVQEYFNLRPGRVGVTIWQYSNLLCFFYSIGQHQTEFHSRVSQKKQKSEFCFATKPTGFHRLDEPPEKNSPLQTHKRNCASNFQFYIVITMGKSAKNLIWS